MYTSSHKLMQSFREGNFVTQPQDVFTILFSRGVLCNSISLKLTNEKFPEIEPNYVALSNTWRTWEFLKRFNEMGGRKVLFQLDENEPIPFEESGPYRYRFGTGKNEIKVLDDLGHFAYQVTLNSSKDGDGKQAQIRVGAVNATQAMLEAERITGYYAERAESIVSLADLWGA